MTETDDVERKRIHESWQKKLAENPWNGWRAMLANWEIEGVRVPVDPNVPFQGYYRSRLQDKTFEPIHFYQFDSKVDGEPVKLWACERPWRPEKFRRCVEGTDEFQRCLDSWIYVSRHPVSAAWYKQAVETKAWPDQDTLTTSEQLQEATKPNAEAQAAREAKIGDNNPPVDIAEVIRNEIDNALAGVSQYAEEKDGKITGKIADDVTSSKALSLKNRLTEISGKAKKARDAASRPHLDALNEIRAKWTPLVDAPDRGAVVISTAMSQWETKKLQDYRAQQARDLEELQKKQREEEAARRAAQPKGLILEEDTKPQPQQPAKPTAAPPAQTQAPGTKISAAYGKSAAVKTQFVALEITDIKALFDFLIAPQPHPELKTKMLELAQRARNAGYTPPGVTFEEQAQVGKKG